MQVAALAAWKGFRIGEIVVEHHPREHGKSKYGWERLPKGFLDLIAVILTVKFAVRPFPLGLIFGTAGLAALVYSISKWLSTIDSAGGLPFAAIGIGFLSVGIYFFNLTAPGMSKAKAPERGETSYEIRRRLE